jgi:hypothetical protein
MTTRSPGSTFGRLYGPIAVAAVLLSTQPLIEPDTSGSSAFFAVSYGPYEPPSVGDILLDLLYAWTIWPSDTLGMIGLLLLLGLAGGLVYAALRPVPGPRLPLGIAAVSTTLICLLLLKPGTGGSASGLSYIHTPPPDLTGAGRAVLALSFLAAGLAVAQTLQLRRR